MEDGPASAGGGRRIALCALAALLLLGFPAAGGRSADRPAPSLDVRASEAPFALAIAGHHGPLTTIGGPEAPLVYWTSDGEQHRATRVLERTRGEGTTTYTVGTDEPGRVVTVTVEPGPNADRITYEVGGRDTVEAIGFDLTASPEAHFLGTGERTDWLDMGGTVVPLKAWSDCHSSAPSSFFVSTAGFGAWVSTPAVGRVAFPGASDGGRFACSVGAPTCSVGPAVAAVRFCFNTWKATVTVAAGSLPELLTAHAESVGLPRAPWLPQFALIKWRDRVSGPADLYDDIHELRSRHIPIGWVLLDNPWERGAFVGSCYGALTFDPTVFPDPAAMIAHIHEEGVRFMLWISPQIRRDGCPSPDQPDSWLTGSDRIFEWDLTQPAARDDYVSRLERLVALGVDGFKGDRADEVNVALDRLADGPGTLFHNLMPLLFERAAATALASHHGTSFATMFRSFVPGSSSVVPGFVGPDAVHEFAGLENEILAAQTAGVAGAPVWGSDVGGYQGGTLTPEVFVRWAQFSALTPIFEVGGNGANSTFWQLGPAAVDGLRAAATLHYELVPYLYALALAASHTGIPVVRALGLSWPSDERAWQHEFEFTVGNDLLAAPVTSPGNESSVYLPAGTWLDLFSGTRLRGSRSTRRENGPRDFPLYVRAGRALPFSFRSPRLWSDDWRPDDLLRDDRQGWLVAAALSSSSRSIADRGSILTERTDAHGTTSLTIGNALREEQLLVYPARPICRVEANGGRLPRVSTTSLPSQPAAWSRRGRAVVVKVSPAPATLRLRLHACS